MASEKLSIPLTATQDRNGKKYYMGRVQFPGTLNLRRGAVFWVFTSESGQEEIQIGVMDKKKDKERQAKRLEREAVSGESAPDVSRRGNQGNY